MIEENILFYTLFGILNIVIGAVLSYLFVLRESLRLQRAKVYEDLFRILLRSFRISPQDKGRQAELQESLNEVYALMLLYAEDRELRSWHEVLRSKQPEQKTQAIKRLLIDLRKKFVKTTIAEDEIVKIEVKPW
jgi:hypothetical protein